MSQAAEPPAPNAASPAGPFATADATAVDHLVGRVPIARETQPVWRVREMLMSGDFDYAGAVYVVDDQQRLAGMIALPELLRAEPDMPLARIIRRDIAAAPRDMDQEHVAHLALRHGMAAVPVVDERNALCGVVPPLTLLQILYREHIEDIDRLSGVLREREQATRALEEPPPRRAGHRLPWLLVGLVGSVLATGIVASFEHALERDLAVAYFIPGIVYLADAIGTQTEATAVRGLSLARAPLRRLFLGELGTGALLGTILALLVFPLTLLAFHDMNLALAVAAAVLVASAVATSVGLAFPALFAHFGKDPALGSGPLGTLVQDLLTLLTYFAAVTLLR